MFFIPITEGVHAVRSDVKIDERPSSTAVAETTENITLTHQVYEDDTTSLSLLSDNGDDVPALSIYDSTSHSIVVDGLSENDTRTITISYDIAAMTLWSGFNTVLDYSAMIWYIFIVALIPLGMVVIWKGR